MALVVIMMEHPPTNIRLCLLQLTVNTRVATQVTSAPPPPHYYSLHVVRSLAGFQLPCRRYGSGMVLWRCRRWGLCCSASSTFTRIQPGVGAVAEDRDRKLPRNSRSLSFSLWKHTRGTGTVHVCTYARTHLCTQHTCMFVQRARAHSYRWCGYCETKKGMKTNGLWGSYDVRGRGGIAGRYSPPRKRVQWSPSTNSGETHILLY